LEASPLKPIHSIEDLEEELSRPTPGVLDTLRAVDGDVMVLGAGGKMGPTLARMVRRGLNEIEREDRRVIAVSRFSSAIAARGLHQRGVETIACDLMDRTAVQALPEAANVIFMAGQKFGTSDRPELTWVMNTLVPAIVAERFPKSRIVVFSTGCVYPLVPAHGPGSNERDALGPPGEYASSCVGRERVFAHFARQKGTHALMFRLCYAIDLRYGVLCDVASKVAEGLPVDVTMGAANVIWQGDANARAIQCLAHVASPPIALNVTGIERVSIRALAQRFGELFDREAIVTGKEAESVWLWDASRSYELFGPPTVSLEEMIAATAHWVRQGGATLGKPTHFEVRDGRF
jgi:nucleoside-diphosphate-sugar epimerase